MSAREFPGSAPCCFFGPVGGDEITKSSDFTYLIYSKSLPIGNMDIKEINKHNLFLPATICSSTIDLSAVRPNHSEYMAELKNSRLRLPN